jgi:hypothetical protein
MILPVSGLGHLLACLDKNAGQHPRTMAIAWRLGVEVHLAIEDPYRDAWSTCEPYWLLICSVG